MRSKNTDTLNAGLSLNEKGLLDPRFLEKSYQEAMALTKAVAAYLEQKHWPLSGDRPSSETEIYYASESMRVSTRLMQVMAWFLVQKGVASGEISKKKAASGKFRLGSRAVCLAIVDTGKSDFPEAFVDFIEKSHNLYRQVARMDDMVYGERDSKNPVHALLSRLTEDEKTALDD